MFYMYYRVIDIIWLLLLVSIPNDNYGQKISCYGDRPFKTKDIECADFSEVCLKQNDPECKSFLDTCKQCPITNTTVRIFLGLLKSSKDGLEKKIEDSVMQQKAVEEQLNHKIASLQRHGVSILVLLIIIIFIAISVIIFKLIKRKPLFGKRKNKPDRRVEISNQTNEYESLVANPNDTHDLKLQQKLDEFLVNIKDISERKSSEDLVHVDQSNKDHSKLLIKFQVQNRETPIKLYVTSDDNVLQTKRQICAKYIDAKLNYKHMQLKYKNRTLNDNQYLLSNVESIHDIVQCEINDAINPNDIIVLKVHGNMHIPGLMQVNRNQTIDDLKKIVSSFNNSKDIKIYKNMTELNNEQKLENCDLKDEDSIQVIGIENGHLIMHSIVGDADPILIEYSNVDLVSSVKQNLKDKLTHSCDEIILYYDGKYLDGNKFMFELNILRSDIEYWRLLKFDRLKITGDPLAIGSSSKIFKATDITSNQDIFIRMYRFEFNSSWIRSKAIVNELRKCKNTKSQPRFVQLGEFYFDENQFGVSMEYLKQSMTDYVASNSSLSEIQIIKWSKQILEGLQILHKHKVVYRNLISSDIFLYENDNIKMSVFGLSKYVLYSNGCKLKGLIQKASSVTRYPAPEVINKNPFTMYTDVWSFGAVLYKMVTGNGPYQGKSFQDLKNQIENNQELDLAFKNTTSLGLQDIIRHCLKPIPTDRPTVDELLHKL